MDITEKIKNEITNFGPLPINIFMQKALSSKEGYYSTKEAIGKNQDFITAPEISQLFGEIIGIWSIIKWQELIGNKQFNLIEFGPGRGILMSDLLRTTKNTSDIHKYLRLYFVEINNKLKKLQKKAVKDYKPKWLESIENVPKKPSIIIANEFFDALPIKQYVRRKKRWYELMVNVKEDSNNLFVSDEAIDDITNEMLNEEYSNVPIDGIIEIQNDSKELIRQICKRLTKYGGAALIIDYGFTESMRPKKSYISTLQAVKNHKFANFLSTIGEADLSSQVNFTQLSETAMLHGCQTKFQTQREFLQEYGIDIRKELLLKKATRQQVTEIIAGYKRIMDTSQMGKLFKVLTLEPK